MESPSVLGKRPRSPSPSPSSPSWKRLKTSSSAYTTPSTSDDSIALNTTPSITTSQDQSLHSPEIFLHILSFLEVKDLVNLESVSGYWKRMAGDGSLWRRLYLASFPYPSIHHLRAHTYTYRRPLLRTQNSSRSLRRDVTGPSPGLTPLRRASLPTPIAGEVALPVEPETVHNIADTTRTEANEAQINSGSTQAESESEPFDDHHQIDWKTLLKIGTNWSTGNASLHSLSPSPSPAPAHRMPVSAGGGGDGVDAGGMEGEMRVEESPLRGRGRRLAEGGALGGERASGSTSGTEYRPLLGGPRPNRPSNAPTSTPPPSAPPATPSSTTSIPHQPHHPPHQPQLHPQAKVPQHLLTLAGPFILVAYPDSPLLHVYGSYPGSAGAVAATGNDAASGGVTAGAGDTTGAGVGGGSVPVSEVGVGGASFALGGPGADTSPVSASDQHSGTLNQPISLIPPPPGWSNPSHPDLITAIAVDDSSHSPSNTHLPGNDNPAIRIAIFYASGGFAIISLTSSTSSASSSAHRNTCNWSRKLAHIPPETLRRRSRKRHFIPPLSERIVLAGMVGDLLVGITGGFYINIWNLRREVRLVQTLHSSVAHWPACLDVRAVVEEGEDAGERTDDGMTEDGRVEEQEDRKYQIRLGYCTPLYPISWKPSLQEISVDFFTGDAKADITISDPIEVIRKTRSFITPSGGLQKIRGEIVGVKGDGSLGPRVMAMDARWLILAGRDNLVEVYDIAAPPSSADGSARKGAGIHHSQTLLAHASAITSVALRHGRCVTAGNDGRVLVWQLDQGPSILANDAYADHAIFESSKIIGGESYHVEIRNRLPGEVAIASASSPSPHDIADLVTLRQRVLPIPPVTHPLSLASAAKELFFLSPRRGQLADIEARRRTRVRGLAFNEETIVGLVNGQAEGGMVRVWKFDA